MELLREDKGIHMRGWGWIGVALIALCLLGAVFIGPREGVMLLGLTGIAWLPLLITAVLLRRPASEPAAPSTSD